MVSGGTAVWRLFVALALGLAACGPAKGPTSKEGASIPGEQAVPFVAFRESSLVIVELERAVVPPVAVGTSLSGDLLSTSDPAVATIDGAGDLVGHRNGTATIRSRSGSMLAVTVDAVATIRIVPDRLDLASGQHSTVHVWAGDHEVASRSLHWEMLNPSIAVATGTTVYAGSTPGEATLTARVGAATATLKVSVRPANFVLRLRPFGSSLNRGEIGRVAVDAPQGFAVEWTSSNKKVLEPMRDGTYYPRGRGIANACATAAGQTACAQIKVR
jgi:hypothetical protein